MPTNVAVPNLGDSVAEATLIKWHKADGEMVKADEPLCELETDKANVDVPSPAAGVFKRNKAEGQSVKIGEVIATIDPSGKPTRTPPPGAGSKPGAKEPTAAPNAASMPPTGGSTPTKPGDLKPSPGASNAPIGVDSGDQHSPAVARILAENKLDATKIKPTGPGGRLTKEDVVNFMEARDDGPGGEQDGPADDVEPATAAAAMPEIVSQTPPATDGVRRTPMSKIRKRIAENLVKAQHTAAILTTFNEVDMTAIMDLRVKYKEGFEKQHKIGLGFMGFFVRAATIALKEFPRVNGQLDGDDIVLFDHVNMGIAVSTERGLAVPVLKNADAMSFAKIESEIKRVALAVRDGKLGLPELSGGTFTITNGGVFGSLLSTPILNAPQSAILGMHKIEQRAVVVNGQIVARPMMYLALSYDHRIIDGRESVSFLVKMKDLLEDPSRMLLGV